MKIQKVTLATLALGLVAGANAGTASPKYIATFITSPSYTSTRATAISPDGKVVGTATTTAGAQVGYMFDGQVRSLSIPSGFTNVVPTGLNSFGRMCGYGTRAISGGSTTTALYWSSYNTTPVQVLPFDGYTNGKSLFYDINEAGTAVGAANGWMVNGVNTVNYQAMSYHGPSNVKTNMTNLLGTASGYAYLLSINNNGYMVGYGLGGDNKQHGVFRYGYNLTLANDPAGSTNGADLRDSNSYFDAIGNSWVSASQSRAFYRTQYGTPVFIPRLAGSTGDDSNFAKSLNDEWMVVGTCEVGNTNNRAFVWNKTSTFDLNSITSGLSGGTITDAVSINDNNEIAGTVRMPDGSDRAVKLTPMQTIQGTLTLSDWLTYPSTIPCQWELVDANSNVVDSGSFTPTILATYSIQTAYRGEANLRIKPSHWLSSVQRVNLIPFETQTQHFTFANGDIDGDNEVSILDYIELSNDYGMDSTMGGWTSAKDSDLDGDGSVSILDYIIMSSNYGLAGN